MLLQGENIIAKQYKYVLQRLFILFYEKIRAKYKKEIIM
jgi:hypothetical protein